MKAVHAGHRVATIKVRRRGYISRHSFTYSIASTSRHSSATAQQPANKNCPRPASTKASVLHCGCRSFFSSTARPTTKATCERPLCRIHNVLRFLRILQLKVAPMATHSVMLAHHNFISRSLIFPSAVVCRSRSRAQPRYRTSSVAKVQTILTMRRKSCP